MFKKTINQLMKHTTHFDGYDDNYVKFYQSKRGEGRIEKIISLIKFKNHDAILDIGCGNGMLFDVIKQNPISYTGLDTSLAFIKICKSQYNIYKNAKFACMSLEKFTKKTSSKFNKIFLLDVAEHVDDKTLMQMLQQCKKLLKPNGKIYLHTPNLDYLIEILKSKNILPQFEEHIAVRNEKQYINLFNKVDINNYDLKYLNHYLYPQKLLGIFSNIPVLGKYFKARLLFILYK